MVMVMVMGKFKHLLSQLKAIVAALSIFLVLPNGTIAFEATQGTSLPAPPTDTPAPAILINDNAKRFPSDVCFHRIGPNLEKELERFMVRLPSSFEKDGETFDWRIGNEAGATYWTWKPLDGLRHQMVLYFPALDLMIKTLVSSTIFGWSDSPAFENGDQWVSDLSLVFVDETTNEGLRIAYWSRPDGNKDEMGRTLPKNENRNVRIRMIERGSPDCRMGG